MSKLEKLKEKARSLEAKDPKGAIEAWQQVLKGQEEDGDPNPDLAVFNRIGDLYLKVREPAQAADYYDQAVDKYAELGSTTTPSRCATRCCATRPGGKRPTSSSPSCTPPRASWQRPSRISSSMPSGCTRLARSSTPSPP